MRRTVLAAAALALMTSLAGCSSSVSVTEVEEQVSTELAAQVGRAPDNISCPDDLPAEVGATMTCVLTDDGTDLDVMLEVTKVEDGTALFDIEVETP